MTRKRRRPRRFFLIIDESCMWYENWIFFLIAGIAAYILSGLRIEKRIDVKTFAHIGGILVFFALVLLIANILNVY